MRVFVTGATGFIGTELVKDLLSAGHQVRGLSRSEQGVAQLQAAGAEPLFGSFTDVEVLRRGANGMDAVVHLAFNHDDWSKFMQSAQDEVAAIEALGGALEPGKRLVVTSGVGMVAGTPGAPLTESDPYIDSPTFPRRPEAAAHAVAERGVHVSVVRLPQVHDTRKQGLVTYLIQTAREKGVSAYVGDGANRWAAAALEPVAHLYRLAVEADAPALPAGQRLPVYNAVGEEGVSLREIAESIGEGLHLPVTSLPPEQAQEHFGLFGRFVSHDMRASSTWTQQALGWDAAGPTMLEDLGNMRF